MCVCVCVLLCACRYVCCCVCAQNLTCDDPVEVPYYSCEAFPVICVHCACPHEAQTKESTLFVIAVIKRGNCPSSSVKERFLVVHPAANYVYF